MARPKKFDEAETLQKALKVFWKKGYSGTSMSDLVSAMSINAPSLYDTYGDKHRLFMASLNNYLVSQLNWMKALSGQTIPVKEIITTLLKALVADTLNDPERKGCFMVNTITELANQDEQVLKVAIQNEKDVREILSQLIKRGQQSGEISSKNDPEIMAMYLFTTMMGVRVVASTNFDSAFLNSTLEFAIKNI